MKRSNHVNIDSDNNVAGYIEESNGNKYFVFASTDKNKELLIKYTKLWDKIKNQIETINGVEPIKYKKDFMKIRLESDDNLPLRKILSIPGMIIVVGSVLQEDNKHYPQVCLHECVYKL